MPSAGTLASRVRVGGPGFWLGFTFVLALALRLALLSRPQPPLIGDAEDYFEASRALAAGEMTGRMHNVLRIRGPGYPLMLTAMFKLLGPDLRAVYVFQALLGSVACLSVHGVGRLLGGPRAGVIAGLLAAVYPPLILHTGLLLSETLATAIFWPGLYLLYRGMAGGGYRWLLAAGLVVGFACITRPSLLPAAPLLMAASTAVGPSAATTGPAGRARRAALFALGLLGPILGWSLLATAAGWSPIAGVSGLKYIVWVTQQAIHPDSCAWALHDPASTAAAWDVVLRRDSAYPLMGTANLVFHHVWFADNIWRQRFLLSPEQIDLFHRGILLLALGGAGLALGAWRAFAPIVAVLGAAAVACLIQPIEARHVLPFVPAFFLLAAVFATRVFEDHPLGQARVFWGLAILLGLVGVGLGAAQPLSVGQWAPSVPLQSIGRAIDVAEALVIVAWGVLILVMWRRRLTRNPALRTAAPVFAFAVLFASYVAVGSGPRWREWTLAGWSPACRVVRRVEPFRPLPADIAAAGWLVDLASPVEPPSLEARLNGARLGPAHWRRWLCPSVEPYMCSVYATFAGFAGPPVPQRRQWWYIEMDPKVVAGARSLELTLEPQPDVVGKLALSGVIGGRTEEGTYGPDVANERTSIFRWLMLEDWRCWDSVRVEPVVESSRLEGDTCPAAPRLATAVAAGDAEPLVRLVIKLADGRQLVY